MKVFSTKLADEPRPHRAIQELIDLPLDALKNIQGIGAKTALRLQASAHAFLLRRPYWWGVLPQHILSSALWIDIRVHPDLNPQRPWGFCVKDPAGHYTIYLEDVLAIRKNNGVLSCLKRHMR